MPSHSQLVGSIDPHIETEVSTGLHTNATTTFVDDSSVPVTIMPLPKAPSASLGLAPIIDKGLKAFFERPLQLSHVDWTNSHVSSDVLYSFKPEDELLANTYWAVKLLGYRFFRGTLVVRVTLNAQPFQQGRLMVHWLPFTSDHGTNYVAAHNYTLRTISTQPNVTLDCRQSSAEFKIPFVHPNRWVDVRADSQAKISGGWGTVYIRVLSPLVSASSTDCYVTTYVSFEDVEFAAPFVPQMSETVGLNVDQSKGLAMNKYITTVANGVPKLASLVAQPAWCSFAKAAVKAAFGFSKPINDKPAGYVVLRPHHNMANSEGESTAETCGLFNANEVKVLPGFAGTDIDEMNFNYIKAIPWYWQSATWSTDQAVDGHIWDDTLFGNIGIKSTAAASGGGTDNFAESPPFAAVASLFQYCRGGLKLHIKAVKTDFHCGRFCVTWIPGGTNLLTWPTPPTSSTSQYGYREIIDLRDSDEWTITLPYALSPPYCKVFDSLGHVYIQVVSPLRTTSITAQYVKFLLYLSAADDFEVAVPTGNNLMVPMVPQGGFDIEPAGVDTFVYSDAEQYCVGETFRSIKQLLTRYSRLYSGPSATDFGNQTAFYFHPFAVGGVTRNSGGNHEGALLGDYYSYFGTAYALSRGGVNFIITQSNSTNVSIQYDDSVGWRRRFAGVTTLPYYSAYGSTVTSPDTANTATKNVNAMDFATAVTGGPTCSSGNLVNFVQSTNGVEFKIPHYSPCASRINPQTYNSVSDVFDLYNLLPYPTALVQYSSQSTVTLKKMFRAGADDCQFGLFIGFPPTYVGTS